MARADHDPRTRAERTCARCHTSWGFLGRDDRRPPDDPIGPIGLTCATCHAVHQSRTVPPAPALLRQPAIPAVLGNVPPGTTRVCLPCHTPAADAVRPEATAGALWAGRGGLDPATGRALDGRPVHATVAGGCTGCHRGAPNPEVHGGNHSFAATQATCTGCHATLPRDRPDPVARARQLWRDATGSGDSHHADGARVDRTTPRGRALWNVLLVLEDRGAAAHNPTYAQALLDAAAPVLAP